ncbi:hypothetical protein ACFOTA_09070 [Chitinophaga sp. GCM10012297]|uniref:Uncharacterized protein n=1 Tax=Chitinophaga chungangae TaxID=2821488 RepID=A0ABS3YCF7_9BACT|nr:hypothetical protein [Chitinophaga chungangae]MBO9152355.1 hypothetical protein [Chitinophaga chungangae]
MRSLILFVPITLLLFACKKDKKTRPDGLNGQFQGVAFTLQNDLKADLTDMYLTFHDGDKFDFIVKLPGSTAELRVEGNLYYTRGSDSVFFHGIEPASSSLVQAYKYQFKGDSLVMIREVSPGYSKQIRLRHVR